MKTVLFTLPVILLLGCFPKCEPGDSEPCHWGVQSYTNLCTVQGHYLDCDCYNGYPSGGGTNNTGSMTGGDQEALNNEFHGLPDPQCQDGEVGIPGTTLCWRICPVGMDWDGEHCTGYPYLQTYQHVENRCREYNPNYRFPSLDETVRLLDLCFPINFSIQNTNYCSPYLTGAIRFVMQVPNEMYFTTWVGRLVDCDDGYGQIGPYCSWFARFHPTIQLDTEFNLLRASPQFGSAMASGMCVRQ